LDEIPGEHTQRLNEFTKEEWFDIGRRCNRNLTWTDFERMWDEWDQRPQGLN
jgi:hypothetical protein